jgi:acetyl-CoA C-acetyltransferase
MTSAVIVSTARTPLAKSWKGAFNMTHGATLGGHAVQHAIQRAGIDAAEVEDVLMGCANPEGATGGTSRARSRCCRLPVTTSGATINRFCSSGLQTIAMAAQRIIAGEADVFVAGGVESISCVQHEMNKHMIRPGAAGQKPEIYWSMLQTAEQVAKRYNIGRDAMDEYGAASQQKACAAQAAGLFDAEIAPITVTMGVADKQLGLITKQVTCAKDEHARRHHQGRHQRHQARAARRPDQRRQRQPVQRRRRRLRGGQRGLRQQKGLKPWAASWALPWPAASPTRWASAPCSPCPRC